VSTILICSGKRIFLMKKTFKTDPDEKVPQTEDHGPPCLSENVQTETWLLFEFSSWCTHY
jgi:hypothetical protein